MTAEQLERSAAAAEAERSAPAATGAENYFKSRAFFKTERDEEDGEKSSPGTGDVPTSPNVSTSPNIRRTISGQHMAAAIARASPNKR